MQQGMTRVDFGQNCTITSWITACFDEQMTGALMIATLIKCGLNAIINGLP